MVIGIDELVSKVDEALFGCEDQHPHLELVRNAVKGLEWYQSSESGYRYLVYHVPSRRKGRNKAYIN